MYKWNGILKFLESRWTGFEPITTASHTKKLLLKSRTGSVFQRSAKLSYHRQLKMSDSNRSSASLTQRATLLHHILSNNPSGNRTRASGATVRRTYRYTMELYCLCRTINSSPHTAQRLALRSLTKKAACLFGQAAVSALITAIYLVTPWLALRRLVPDITWSGLIKAYTNRPFRVLGGRHNCPLKIKQAMCIIHSVCIHLQHCLAFPFRTCCPFFTMLNISLVVPAVILPVV